MFHVDRCLGAALLLAGIYAGGARAEACPQGQSSSRGQCCERDAVWDARFGRCAAGARLACAGGELAQCVLVGDHYADPRSSESDARQATVYYRKACAGGELAACTGLARLSLRGSTDAHSVATARALFRRACEGGHAAGCTGLGELSARAGAEPSEVLALFEGACERGDARGCSLAALAASQGEANADVRARAEQRARGACDVGDLLGCSVAARLREGQLTEAELAGAEAAHAAACDAGELLGCMHLGELASRDGAPFASLSRARGAYSRACEGGLAGACLRLGELFDNGRGGEQDESAARRSYRAACKLGEENGCSRFAQRVLAAPIGGQNPADLRSAYDAACRMGNRAMCLALARELLDGEHFARDVARARALLDDGCAAGGAEACFERGELLGYGAAAAAPGSVAQLRGWQEAAESLARACDGGLARACVRLGLMQMNGQGAPRNFPSALSSFSRACEAGEADGCLYLARQTAFGHGIERDETLAATRLERACALGAMEACTDQLPDPARLYPAPYVAGIAAPARYALPHRASPAVTAAEVPWPREGTGLRERKPPVQAEVPAASRGPRLLGGFKLGIAEEGARHASAGLFEQRVAFEDHFFRAQLPLLFAGDRFEGGSGERVSGTAFRAGNVAVGGGLEFATRALARNRLTYAAVLPTASLPARDADDQVTDEGRLGERSYAFASALWGLEDHWLWTPDVAGAALGYDVLVREAPLRFGGGADLALVMPLRDRSNGELIGQAHVELGVEHEGFVAALRTSVAALSDEEVVNLALQPWLGYQLPDGACAFLRLTLNVAQGGRLDSGIEPPGLGVALGLELR